MSDPPSTQLLNAFACRALWDAAALMLVSLACRYLPAERLAHTAQVRRVDRREGVDLARRRPGTGPIHHHRPPAS
jgi:hypothetical protein